MRVLDSQCGRENPAAREPSKKKDVELTPGDEAARENGEDHAESLRAHVESVHENDRRAGDIGEEAGEREGPCDGVSAKLRLFEQVSICSEE